jgi:UDP-glucose 4-epimerase
MRAFVTGGAGFIGSHLVERLIREGNTVTVYDNLSTGTLQYLNSAYGCESFKFIEADLLDRNTLNSSISGHDNVFHFAANADIRHGLENPFKDLEQNTIATFNLLEAMRNNGLRKIVFASSAAALGEPEKFPTPETCATPIQTSLYGASKMACEGLISSYCEGYNFEGYSYRFVSLLGPRYPHGHVFDFVKQLRNNPKKLKILGDGMQKKSYMHINDCIDAIVISALEKKTADITSHNYQIYHLGNTEYILLNDSIKWICDQMQVSPKISYIGGQRGWVGDQPFVFLDVSKIMNEKWKPTHTIEESIRETADWLNSNPWIFDTR